MQGFLYSKPLDEAAFAAMLTSGKVELWSDKSYWDAAGRFNLLSANPLEAFGAKVGEESAEDLSLYHSDIPLALLQCTWKSVNYIYASEGYLKRLRALGFSDIDNVEHAFNEKTNPRYGQLKKLILDAITRDRVQDMDDMTRDVYYKFKVRCIAKTRSKAVVAAYLRTFDSDQDVEQRDELMKYSKAL